MALHVRTLKNKEDLLQKGQSSKIKNRQSYPFLKTPDHSKPSWSLHCVLHKSLCQSTWCNVGMVSRAPWGAFHCSSQNRLVVQCALGIWGSPPLWRSATWCSTSVTLDTSELFLLLHTRKHVEKRSLKTPCAPHMHTLTPVPGGRRSEGSFWCLCKWNYYTL